MLVKKATPETKTLGVEPTVIKIVQVVNIMKVGVEFIQQVIVEYVQKILV
tara:strand:- start:379 stop:528 length:150 start_codon:yes stop_codon:yes gene_type:complete